MGHVLADALRDLADRMDAHPDEVPPSTWMSVDFQPGSTGSDDDFTDDQRAEMVDRLAVLLLGKPGARRAMYDGTYHHSANGGAGKVHIAIYDALVLRDEVPA